MYERLVYEPFPRFIDEAHPLYRSHLDLVYQRVCGCSSKAINCATTHEQFRFRRPVFTVWEEDQQTPPIAMIRWCIRAYSHQGDLIVDPFAGFGTTLRAASLEQRHAVGLDVNRQALLHAYYAISVNTKGIYTCIVDSASQLCTYLNTSAVILTEPPLPRWYTVPKHRQEQFYNATPWLTYHDDIQRITDDTEHASTLVTWLTEGITSRFIILVIPVVVHNETIRYISDLYHALQQRQLTIQRFIPVGIANHRSKVKPNALDPDHMYLIIVIGGIDAKTIKT